MKKELAISLALLATLCLADIQVDVDEEVPPGTEVTRMTAHRSAYGNLTDDQVQAMTYFIINQNSPPASYFRIELGTEVVSVASRMDRETICDRTENCSVTIMIAIRAGSQARVSFSNVVTLTVVINDINDNPPRFPARDVTLEIPEGAKVKTELKISGAVDLDSKPEFTVQHYNITPALNTFSLRPTINLDGSSTLNLRLEKELDRETIGEYHFNIMAYDEGPHPQSDFLSVTVKVLDDNDNIPKFDRSKYEVTVNTNQESGAKIVQVTATDEDIGNYGRVTYSFSPSSEVAIKGVFAIDSSSGWITLAGDLRTIRRSSPFLMFVDARDNGDPPLSSQALVSVAIINSENNPPYVKVKTEAAGDVSSLAIPESAALDDFVAFVDVEDNDDGENGKVTCQIKTSSDFKLSPVPVKGYTLLLNTSVDREKKDSYQILVSCKDGGTPPLETEIALTVNITDINDNTPKFNNNLYTGEVNENVDAGKIITYVLAHDDDIGINAVITYSLPKEAMDYIRIHPRNGAVSTSAPLDRERNSTLRFKVFATDSGEPPRTGVAEILIVVKDVNDNSPIFNVSKFVLSVSEQALNGTSVGVLEASDLDINSNGQFDFYFGGSTYGDLPLPFAVLKNGSILVTGFLDRETKDRYSFTALVRDRGDTPRSSTVPVEIRVLDENDNEPVILFPTSKNHTIIISNFPENGMVLGRIIAYDMDEGAAAELRYFIYDGDVDKAFSIGVNTGELIIQNVERLQNNKEYYLLIKVEDASASPRNITTQLRIEAIFDNTTGAGTLQQTAGSRDQYVIIVGVIGGATIVLSAIIISAIFLILRSERNRSSVFTDQSIKNKFFAAATVQGSLVQTRVDNLDVTKSQSSSSLGSDPHGMILGPGAFNKKTDDGQKKVSFNLQEESVDQRQVHLPEKKFRLNLHPIADGNAQWKQYSSPDDISSDTSGESGACDSGRGTSDEDIKFDYLLTRGQTRIADHFHPCRDRSFDQISLSNLSNSRTSSSYKSQDSPRQQISTPLLHPSHPYFLESGQARTGNSAPINNYNGIRHFPLSSFSPEAPPSSRPTNQQQVYNVCNQKGVNFNPSQTMAHKQHEIMDDDVSTTTSGSYFINPDDVRLEVFTNRDVVL